MRFVPAKVRAERLIQKLKPMAAARREEAPMWTCCDVQDFAEKPSATAQLIPGMPVDSKSGAE